MNAYQEAQGSGRKVRDALNVLLAVDTACVCSCGELDYTGKYRTWHGNGLLEDGWAEGCESGACSQLSIEAAGLEGLASSKSPCKNGVAEHASSSLSTWRLSWDAK